MNQTENNVYQEAIKAWYKKGKLVGFDTLQEEFKDPNPDIQKLDEKLYQSLLIERNTRFSMRIQRLLLQFPSKNFFFAIGAGHFPLKSGLIHLLTNKGYQLRKIL